jgi:hypothetical protein
MVSANFVTKHMIQSSLSCLVHSYPLASADNSTSYLSLKKKHRILQACRGSRRPGGAARSPAPELRGGGRPSTPHARRPQHTGGYPLPPDLRHLPAGPLSPPSLKVGRPAGGGGPQLGRGAASSHRRPSAASRCAYRRPAAAPLPARHRSAVAPLRGWIILGVKAPVPHGIGFTVDRAYNGAEAADNTWVHEPLPSSRETTAASSLGRGKGGLQTRVVRALRI